LRVILVETNAQSAQVLARFFEEREDEVWHAWKLEEASALLDLIQPDLMLLDLHFPGDEWLNLLRKAHQDYPKLKIIITSKQINLQREILAKQYGGRVFVRAPFTQQWLEQAMVSLEDESSDGDAAESIRPPFLPIRIPVQLKLTLPFFALVVLILAAGIYIERGAARYVFQQQFEGQLSQEGRETAAWMVQQEQGMLSVQRLIANTQEIPLAISSNDVGALQNLAAPLATNFKLDALEILNLQGVSLFSMHLLQNRNVGDYSYSHGETYFQKVDFVQKSLKGFLDRQGDKFDGLIEAPWGTYYYIAGPVYDMGGQIVGNVLVGTSLQEFARDIQANFSGDVVFYDINGAPLITTYSGLKPLALEQSVVTQLAAASAPDTLTHEIKINGNDNVEVLIPWKTRGNEEVGLIGISKPMVYNVALGRDIQFQILLWILFAVSLVLFISLYLARLLTKPLKTLTKLSEQVSEGNLDVKMEPQGEDEFAVVAHSFNAMVVGLQESFLFKDFLDRRVSPELRRQLRRTLETGGVGLQGREAVVTVLTADIRGFSTFAEQASPVRVFDVLNEYFERLAPVIADYGGVVNRFDGDSLLAYFGILPRWMNAREGADKACQAALEMLEILEDFGNSNRQDGRPMIAGIGMHTGNVVAGGLGAMGKLHYTVVGDTVNTAKRIEVLSRDLFSTSGILISQDTFDALEMDQFKYSTEPFGIYPLKRRSEGLKVYRLLSYREPNPGGMR
jgi:class 3 adenylate cyclase/CheY-like chemotaxis protein